MKENEKQFVDKEDDEYWERLNNDEEFWDEVNSADLTGYAKEYKERISKELIPLYCVMGDEVLYGKFHGDTEEVYKYCLEHNVKWEEVLNFKFNPDVLY